MKKKSVCAIIVCYFPIEKELFQQFKATREQVAHIVYIINESLGEAETLISLIGSLPEVDIIRNEYNEGVAHALNQGVNHAKKHGYEHVLFLDQDSIPYPDMVEKLIHAYNIIERQCNIAAVGPLCIDSEGKDSGYFVRYGNSKIKKIYCGNLHEKYHSVIPSDFLVSSGSLSKTIVFDKIGGMDELLFIDHVDTEWFLRARNAGYYAFGVCDALMEHSIGTKRRRIWFGKWVRVAYHKPLRHYYLFRNGFIIMRRRYIGLRWKICELRRLAIIFLYFSFFSDQNLENITKMVKGVLDGISISKLKNRVLVRSDIL